MMASPPFRSWWHELNTWDPQQALDFYGRTLGWEFEASPLPDGASYWIARQGGRPVGGICELRAPACDGIPSHWMTYMTVTDIRAAESEVEDAGGEVMRPAVPVPGLGKLSLVIDTAGAVIGFIEPDSPRATPERPRRLM